MTEHAPPAGRGGGALLAVAVAAAGVSGYLCLLLAAKVLDPADNADFIALWSLFFTATTLVSGVGLHTSAVAGRSATTSSTVRGARESLARTIRPVVPIVAVAALALSWLVVGRFDYPRWFLPCLLVVGVAGYACHTALLGSLAALGEWTAYGGLLIAEALVRLTVLVTAAMLLGTPTGMSLGLVGGMVVWLAVLPLGWSRRAWSVSTGEDTVTFLRHAGQTMVGTIGPAVLVVGFPMIVKWSSAPAEYASSAALLLAVIVTRAPFLMPLSTLQSAVVVRARRGGYAVGSLLGGLAGAGVVAALLAVPLGPPVLSWFAAGYRVSGAVMGLLVAGATLLAVLSVLAALRLAQGRRLLYLGGWLSASAVSCLVLWLPASLEMRVVASLLLGPLLGCLVLAVPRSFTVVPDGRATGALEEPGATMP